MHAPASATRTPVVAFLVCLLGGVAPAAMAAQAPPAPSPFGQLGTRLKPGDTVWVTDAQGREIEGTLQTLSADGMTVRAGELRTYAAGDVRVIQHRTRDSLLNGALIGWAVGGSLWCGAALADTNQPGESSDGVECAEGFAALGGLGALIGLGIDASRRGPKVEVYRASGGAGGAAVQFAIAPAVTSRAAGVVAAIRF